MHVSGLSLNRTAFSCFNSIFSQHILPMMRKYVTSQNVREKKIENHACLWLLARVFLVTDFYKQIRFLNRAVKCVSCDAIDVGLASHIKSVLQKAAFHCLATNLFVTAMESRRELTSRSTCGCRTTR